MTWRAAPTVRCRSETPLSSMVRRSESMAGMVRMIFAREHAVADSPPGPSLRRNLALLPEAKNDVVHEAHSVAHPGLHGIAQAGRLALRG